MIKTKFDVESYTKEYINKTNSHLYIKPIKELEKIVAHYTITFPNEDNDIKEGSVLNLVPDVSGCFVFKFFDQLSIKVWGPTTEVVTVKNDLNIADCRFFVEFLPGGLYRILGIGLNELLNKKIDLEDIQLSLYEEINNEIMKMNSFDEIVDFINQILLREVQKYKVNINIYKWIEDIDRQHKIMNPCDIATALGISERQLHRYFNRYVGMGVKKYSKYVNVNHLIKELIEKDLLDLTFDYHYFDQSHFNHTFKEVCQTTPTHYIENLSDFYNELYKF
ncbi:MAG: helix-turn-helix domain-containing protein [Coprobacillus sp.]